MARLIKSLSFPPGPQGCGLFARPVRLQDRVDQYSVTLFRDGITARRYLTPDELRALGDWIDGALAAREKEGR